MPRKLTKQEFITCSKKIHGDKYDYKDVNYVNSKTKVIIICPEHGPFEQTPNSHLNGRGCPDCGGHKKNLTKESFIAKARKIHGDTYDYSEVKYTKSNAKVTIICPEHGPFKQSPNSHLSGHGCPDCGSSQKLTKETFIAKADEIHKGTYDYSKVVYVNNKTKVTIICPEHGPFKQTPSHHLSGFGCPDCGGKQKLTKESFIAKADEIHGDTYNYSEIEYVNSHTKVTIICPEHGPFKQTPNNHLRGNGCPKCNNSQLEVNISQYLKNKEIKYIEQKTWDWLRCKGKMRCDIFLPDFNIVIECQGRQHFEPVDYFGGEDGYDSTLYRDSLKRQLLEEHGIKVLYYTDVLLETYPYKVYTDLDTLYRTIVDSKNMILRRA